MASKRLENGTGRQPLRSPQAEIVCAGLAELREEANVTPVEPDLIGRLIRAAMQKLRRPIR
jgi:hypothetical protein